MSSEVFVGVDLAWGLRARTGVAVLDGTGRLVESKTVCTDTEIDTWLDRIRWRPVCVGIDAPLVVTNATGQRPCETAVSQAFGRYAASCHSSNLAKSWFDPPRGWALVQRRGWSVDFRRTPTGDEPVALEVHPHAAMVGLWSLPRTLQYKARGGRPFEVRASAFGALVGHLEAITELDLAGNPRWAVLRAAAAAATRHVDLERIEDEVDSIVCAYLAWLWVRRPGTLVAYGDVDNGCIVAPPAPTHPAGVRAQRSRTGSASTP